MMTTVRAVEFWTSVESHGCQKALIGALRARGWSVDEFFAVSSETYRGRSKLIRGIKVRFNAYILYPVKLGLSALGWRPSKVYVVSSNTFYAPLIATWAAGRGVSIVHWVLDLYPDALVVARVLPAEGLVVEFLRLVMQRIIRSSSANVFLGEGLLRYAEKSLGGGRFPVVIPIGADDQGLADFELDFRCGDLQGGVPRILYCGNMGHMHDVDTLILLFERAVALPVVFEFRGHGIGLKLLKSRVTASSFGDEVVFGPGLGDNDWRAKLAEAHIALVTMKPGADGIVMPSKTYSAMLAGQAILAICPLSCDLAEMILGNDIGWVVEPGDVDGLHELLLSLRRDPKVISGKRMNSHATGWAMFRSGILAEKWIDLFGRIARPVHNVDIV